MRSTEHGRNAPGLRLGALLLAGALATPPCTAADKLYYFTDEQGVAHFSNVPHDPRYRAVIGAGAVLPRFDERVAPLELNVSAAAAIRKGATLEVSIAMPGTANVRGLIDLVYDPAALVFDDATVGSDVVGEGRVRLHVDPGIASVFAAQVWFAVRRDAPDQTVVKSEVVDLESDERVVLHGKAPAPLMVRLEPAHPSR
jgi:hypothetical protein